MNSQTVQSQYPLGFIGAGKLAGSVLRGLIRGEFCMPSEVLVSEPDANTRTAFQKELGINATTDNAQLADEAEVIVVAVKPAVVLPVLRDVSARIERKLVISLAAGIRLKNMEEVAPARFMRAMTNTPSTVCRAATALARGNRTNDDDLQIARKMFGAIGVVVNVDEEQIDAATALSGSGPAFVYTVIEALAQGGVKMGLAWDVALTLATQTVLGAAQLASETKLSPEALRKMVVTPGGTTAAGLAMMEKHGTAASLIAAVEAAAKRGQEMARENR
jgi:pyrroline-5-carboxylate reductase